MITFTLRFFCFMLFLRERFLRFHSKICRIRRPGLNTTYYGGKKMLNRIYSLLASLGITANYVGFFYAAHALELAVSDMENLLLVTKRIYPEIAKYHHTSAKNVERNIRTVINVAWDSNPGLLEELAKRPLPAKPTATEFLAILSAALLYIHPADEEKRLSY